MSSFLLAFEEKGRGQFVGRTLDQSRCASKTFEGGMGVIKVMLLISDLQILYY